MQGEGGSEGGIEGRVKVQGESSRVRSYTVHVAWALHMQVQCTYDM